MNLHLGTMIRNKKYRNNITFAKYMKANVNDKLVPVQNNPTGRKVERELYFKEYYTTGV